MAASLVAGLLMACTAGAQEGPKLEKTLTFIRDAAGQEKPTSIFTVPPPTVRPSHLPMPSREAAAKSQGPQRLVSDTNIRKVTAQTPGPEDDAPGVLPGPSRLFKRISEKDVFDEIRMQARRKPGSVRPIFPEETIISKDKWIGRHWSPMIETVEPNYVGHNRLYFEQQNFERGGWDFGIFQPMLSLGVFYADVITLPYQFWTRPLQRHDTSAGKCLPGDPSPLFLYPPELNLSGTTAEAATIVGLLILFPR